MKGEKMSKKNRYKFDPMSPALGALRSFQDRLLGIGIKVERGGDGFAISAKFPYLNLANGIENMISYGNSGSDAVGLLKQVINQCNQKSWYHTNTNLILLPTEASAATSSITPSAGIGGGEHEIGHAIYDMANRSVREDEIVKNLAPTIQRLIDKGYKPRQLHKWTNITADMRLERWLSLEYPLSRPRLEAVQKWVYSLEAKVRADKSAQNFPSHVLMYLRDVGKGHYNADFHSAKSEYHPDAIKLVDSLDYLWKQLIPRDGDTVEETVHLPLLIALSLMEAIEDGKNPPPPPPPQDDPQEPPQEPPQDDPQEPPQEPPQGDDPQGDDPQEPPQGDDPQDDPQGDDPQEPSNEGGDPVGEKEIDDLLKGAGKALDPSTAYEEDKKSVRKKIDHTVYTGSGERYTVKGKLF
jgi:hypothetical protein